jgi:putative pyruvate formate lyase activating enzyme
MLALPPEVHDLQSMIHGCRLCPRRCGVNRPAGELGECGIDATPLVASFGPHFGEEAVLVGTGGSGTIFFAGCNLHCAFCQNADISQQSSGAPVRPDALADLMVHLERVGCENVNLVSPTHVAHAVAEAVVLARRRGLSVPVVYNCGGYESVEVLERLAGLVEIYMPDFKYGRPAAGRMYSGVDNYPAVAEAAVVEMYRQVGPLQVNGRGVAVRGVLVRHLVMPANLADGQRVVETVARIAPGAALSIMAQYRPAHEAHRHPELLSRPDAHAIAAMRAGLVGRGLVDASR